MPLLITTYLFRRETQEVFFPETLINKYMNNNQLKCLLTMQSSIAQMLIISGDKLPSDEQLIESVIASVKYVQETENFELDKEVVFTMCELAINIRNTVKNPEEYLMKMIEKLF